MKIGNGRGTRTVAPMLGLAMTLAACGSDDDGPPAWNPEVGGTSEPAGTTAFDGSTSDPGTDDGMADGTTGGATECTPGEVTDCVCPDGTDGDQICDDDGLGFGACMCDDDSGSTGDGGSTDDSGGEMGDVVCYPGQANDFSTCVPIHAFAPMPEGYEYPPPYMGNDNYRAPVALIDLEEIDPDTWLAPNFQLGEIAQPWKGRYAVVQPHAIVSLQALRDVVGAISVNSGYRSPAYNASLDGSATYSRHMYGDAYDLDPIEVGLGPLEQACTAQGGMLVEYTSHVHCDFRFDPVDEQFYGPPMAAAEAPLALFDATVVLGEDGLWSAPAEGFDEGAPQRRWVALDAEGAVLATAVAERFAAPLGTATVQVRVGAQLERSVPVL